MMHIHVCVCVFRFILAAPYKMMHIHVCVCIFRLILAAPCWQKRKHTSQLEQLLSTCYRLIRNLLGAGRKAIRKEAVIE